MYYNIYFAKGFMDKLAALAPDEKIASAAMAQLEEFEKLAKMTPFGRTALTAGLGALGGIGGLGGIWGSMGPSAEESQIQRLQNQLGNVQQKYQGLEQTSGAQQQALAPLLQNMSHEDYMKFMASQGHKDPFAAEAGDVPDWLEPELTRRKQQFMQAGLHQALQPTPAPVPTAAPPVAGK